MAKTLYIMRGMPGAGKSTYAANRWPGLTPATMAPAGFSPVSVSIDHFFTDFVTGEYNWSIARLSEGIAATNVALVRAMGAGIEDVILDNTHSRHWEYKTAEALAEALGYHIEVIDLFDGGCCDEELVERGIHKVPEPIIIAMRERWEPDERAPLPKVRLCCPEQEGGCGGTWTGTRNHGKTIRCPRCFRTLPSYLFSGSGRDDEYPEEEPCV